MIEKSQSDTPEESRPGQRRRATPAEAKALASPVRLRILRACLDEALTNKQIAERTGLNPASTLHHVRTLVATGFLAAGEERRGARGAREIPYLATGKSWLMEVYEDEYPAGKLPVMVQAFIDELSRSPVPMTESTRMGLRLSREELEDFTGRLYAVFEEFRDRPPTPGGTPYSLYFGMHLDTARIPPAAKPGRDRRADVPPWTHDDGDLHD